MKFVKISLMFIAMLFVVTAATALVNQPSVGPNYIDCSDITSLGLVKSDTLLDSAKVIALFNSSDSFLSYYCVKNMLGLYDYDMYIEITTLNGQYLALDDILLVYGVYPGKVTYDNVLRQIDTTVLVEDELYSSNYVPLGTFTTLRNSIEQQQLLSEEEEPTLFGLPPGETPESYTIKVIDNMTPDIRNYTASRTFSRLASLNMDGTVQIVKITLGVWI